MFKKIASCSLKRDLVREWSLRSLSQVIYKQRNICGNCCTKFSIFSLPIALYLKKHVSFFLVYLTWAFFFNVTFYFVLVQFSSVQSLSHVRLFATSWIAARQASLSITSSQSSLRLTSIESVMPSSHLILGHPLLLLPPIPPSIRVFSNESILRMRWPKYRSFSFSIIPSKENSGLIYFRMDWSPFRMDWSTLEWTDLL